MAVLHQLLAFFGFYIVWQMWVLLFGMHVLSVSSGWLYLVHISTEVVGKKQLCHLHGKDGRHLANHSHPPTAPSDQISCTFPHTSDTTASFQQFQHQGKPHSFILKMQTVTSSTIHNTHICHTTHNHKRRPNPTIVFTTRCSLKAWSIQCSIPNPWNSLQSRKVCLLYIYW
jgi:hypothetical protein